MKRWLSIHLKGKPIPWQFLVILWVNFKLLVSSDRSGKFSIRERTQRWCNHTIQIFPLHFRSSERNEEPDTLDGRLIISNWVLVTQFRISHCCSLLSSFKMILTRPVPIWCQTIRRSSLEMEAHLNSDKCVNFEYLVNNLTFGTPIGAVVGKMLTRRTSSRSSMQSKPIRNYPNSISILHRVLLDLVAVPSDLIWTIKN